MTVTTNNPQYRSLQSRPFHEDESSPLILSTESPLATDQRDLLQKSIASLCQQDPVEDPDKQAKMIARGFAILMSASAKVGYIPISMKLGPVLGPVAATANSIGFFILEYWAANGTITSALPMQTLAEKELLQAQETKSTCQKVLFLIPALIVAMSSQLPTVLAGVNYNEEKYKIPAAVALITSGSLIPLRSIQLSIEQLYKTLQKGDPSEAIVAQRKMVDLLRKNHQAFIEMSKEEKEGVLADLSRVRQMSESADKTNQYLTTFLGIEPPHQERANDCFENGLRYAGLGLGVGLSGVFEYALGDYTFNLTKKEVFDNDALAVTFACLAVVCTSYLYIQSIVGTSQRVFSVVGDLANGTEARNLGWQLRPKLSAALTTLALSVDALALGPTYVVWGDFYDQNKGKHDLFLATMCASLFLILFTATLDIANDLCSYSIMNGSDEEKSILALSQELQRLAATIEKSSPEQFEQFLTSLPEGIKERFSERSMSRF